MDNQRMEGVGPAGSRTSGYNITFSPAPIVSSTPPLHSYNEPGVNSAFVPYSPQPSYDHQNSKQQLIVVQMTPQASVVSTVPAPSGGNSCLGRKWSRKNGFCIAGTWVVLGVIAVILITIYSYTKYNVTKDFHEGRCKTVKKFQIEEPELYTCDAIDCDKNCEKPFVCYKIVGKILYSSTNQSKPTQIYASYEDIERRQGDCSYLPKLPCKGETEKYFISSGALDEGDEYTCYYSTREPMKVVLKKTSFILGAHLLFPVIFICCGVLMFSLVKFCGHRCGCPSWSQMRKLQQQQSSVQIQMQPFLVQRSR